MEAMWNATKSGVSPGIVSLDVGLRGGSDQGKNESGDVQHVLIS